MKSIYEMVDGARNAVVDVKIAAGTTAPFAIGTLYAWASGIDWVAVCAFVGSVSVAALGAWAAVAKARYYGQRRRHEAAEWEQKHPEQKNHE